MQTYNVMGSASTNPTGALIVRAGSAATLIRNTDSFATLYLSNQNSIDVTALSNAIALGPGGSIVVDGTRNVYAVAGVAVNSSIAVQEIEGGISFFQPISSLRLVDPNGTDFILLSTGHPPFIEIATGDVAETVPAKIISGTIGSGPTRQLAVEMFANRVSGEPFGEQAAFILISPSVDLSLPPEVQFTAGDGTSSSFVTVLPTTVTLSGNQLLAQRNRLGVAVLFGNIGVDNSDATSITVTAAVATRMTTSWNIPANDPNAATLYRITADFNGTQGSTAETLAFSLTAFNHTLSGTAIPAAFAAISTNFGGSIVGTIRVISTGAGTASIVYNFAVIIKQQGATTATPFSGFTNTTAGDTSTAQPLFFSAAWGATTGSPTITCTGSTLERIGA